MTFSEHSLTPLLPTLSPQGKFYLAYSGGLDSHVLLLAISRLPSANQLIALHVNHGLSPNADNWQAHCQKVCHELGIEIITRQVTVEDPHGESLENVARHARYKVFNDLLSDEDCLLMGHHQNDQLETILFRLMRGSGPKGLSAIPQQRPLNKGYLFRPLLNFSRPALLTYAQTEKLTWIEDESNSDTRFDRNFLRQKIFPLLKERWPSFEKNWQRSAQLNQEAERLQSILGEQDLLPAYTDYPNRLNIEAFSGLELIRQSNLLRVWFSKLHDELAIPKPDYQSLYRIVNEVLPAADDAQPLVTWCNNEIEVRRFANHLYVLKKQSPAELSKTSSPPLNSPPLNSTIPLSSSPPLSWKVSSTLTLPHNLGTLTLVKVPTHGLDLNDIKELKICFREGGEKAKPAGRKTRPLKKIFQDYKIPPWLRDKIPLIYFEDELIAVGDLFICDKWQQEKGPKLHQICWEKPDIHCCY